jgi:hypothetical protein
VTRDVVVAQVAWAFSIFLEAVAIIPQLIVLHADKLVENVTSHYVACLGAYRALYIVNWIYKYMTVPNYSHWIVWIAGIVQTAFYCDFFYYYVKRCVCGGAVVLCCVVLCRGAVATSPLSVTSPRVGVCSKYHGMKHTALPQ